METMKSKEEVYIIYKHCVLVGKVIVHRNMG